MAVWKNIANYDEMYEVSCDGEIRSKNRFTKSISGRKRFVIGRVIKTKKNRDGYLFVTLSKNGQVQNLYVHRIVAETYISNPDNKPQVNHIDGDKKNNSVDNLEWVSVSENTKHAYKNGLSGNIGATHCFAKKLIDNCTGKEYGCIKEAANDLGINYTTLRNMLCGSNKNKTCLEYYNKG
jgi:hypothetical protein